MKKYNLTAKHWWVMILCCAAWYVSTATSADGLNVTIPGFTELFGSETYSTLLTFNTVAGIFAMFVAFICGALMKKYGQKKVMFASGMIAGIGYFAQGFVQGVPGYFITLMLGAGFVNTMSAQCCGPYVASWLPRKRGLAMGVITAGAPLCTATYLWIINASVASFGFRTAVSLQGVMCFAVAILALLTTKDTPEEAGTTPDNMPEPVDEKVDNYVSPWTPAKLFKTKEMWLITFAYGFLMMANTGVISQLIPRLTVDKGLEMTTATAMFSTAAVAGVVLSLLWGKVDEWIGTKKASIAMCIWFICSVIINLIPGKGILVWLSVIMIGGDLGGTANFLVSMVTKIFGRKDFNAAYAIIFPMYNTVRTFAFAYTGLMAAVAGNVFGQTYAGGYLGLIVLCLISIFCLLGIDYNKTLGDDDLGLE